MIAKSINVLLLLIFILLFSLPAHAANSCLGFRLPSGSTEVSENRYLISKAWDITLKFYRRAYAGKHGIRKSNTVAVPGVKSVHYENQSRKGKWQGANISRIRGKIYVFCYPKPPKDKKGEKRKK